MAIPEPQDFLLHLVQRLQQAGVLLLAGMQLGPEVLDSALLRRQALTHLARRLLLLAQGFLQVARNAFFLFHFVRQ